MLWSGGEGVTDYCRWDLGWRAWLAGLGFRFQVWALGTFGLGWQRRLVTRPGRGLDWGGKEGAKTDWGQVAPTGNYDG